MKRFVGVLVFAAFVGLIGLGLLAGSAATRVQTTTFNIQPGANYCTYRSISVLAGGTVTITYIASPGSVYQYVLTDAQHTAWLAGSGISYIGVDQGSANTFTTTLPSGGTYYVLSCHGTGYENTLQSGQHTVAVAGIDPGGFYEGIGALVITLVLVLVALRVRKRDAARVPLPSTPPPYVPGWGEAAGAWPGVPGGSAPPAAAAAFGNLVVTLENRSAAEETVELLLNGVPALTVIVPAGGTSQATLHPSLTFPAGTAVRIEAATPDGRRGAQDVIVRTDQAATVTLQIG